MENESEQILNEENRISRNYSSTTALTENPEANEPTNNLFTKSEFFRSKRKVIVVSILFVINLINYIDRFTVAGFITHLNLIYYFLG
jgi:hypothetical protein